MQSGSERKVFWMRDGEVGRRRRFSWQYSVAVLACKEGKTVRRASMLVVKHPSQGSAIHGLHKGRLTIA